ncbi:hypothetical protein MLPF_2266 [Mycobacterium lepromatosis]|nr:hypothetical protein MLPF_2266 [Mycobacterium lepromatosis]
MTRCIYRASRSNSSITSKLRRTTSIGHWWPLCRVGLVAKAMTAFFLACEDNLMSQEAIRDRTQRRELDSNPTQTMHRKMVPPRNRSPPVR